MAVDQYRHLVRSALNGDPKAWSALGDSYHQRILDYCRIFLPVVAQAELAVQETFLHAWNNRDSSMEADAFDSWIFSTARAICAKSLTGSDIGITYMAVLRRDEEPAEPVRDSGLPSRPLHPLSSAAEPIMTRLDQLDRVIFHLSFVERMTSEQIAVNLLPPVSSRAIRARIALNIEPLIATLQANTAGGVNSEPAAPNEPGSHPSTKTPALSGAGLPATTEQLVTILRAENGSWTPSCIAPDVLLEIVAFPGSRSDTLDLLDHVAVCAMCRRAYSETRSAYHMAELERRSAAHPTEPAIDVFTRTSVPADRAVVTDRTSQRGSGQMPIGPPRPLIAGRPGLSIVPPQVATGNTTRNVMKPVGYLAGILSIALIVVGTLGIHQYHQRTILERSRFKELRRERDLEAIAAVLKRTAEESNTRARMLELKVNEQGATGAGLIQSATDSNSAMKVTRSGTGNLAGGHAASMVTADSDVATSLSLPSQLTAQAVRARKLSREGEMAIPLDSPDMVSVIETRPRFTWERVAGIGRYRIQILDHDMKPTGPSIITSATTILQSKDLIPGATYTWSVTANRGRRSYSGHGSFLILKPTEVKQIDALHRDGSLKLGVAYAKAGLFDAAYDQFLWAIKRDPKDANAKRLRDELIANRHFK